MSDIYPPHLVQLLTTAGASRGASRSFDSATRGRAVTVIVRAASAAGLATAGGGGGGGGSAQNRLVPSAAPLSQPQPPASPTAADTMAMTHPEVTCIFADVVGAPGPPSRVPSRS